MWPKVQELITTRGKKEVGRVVSRYRTSPAGILGESICPFHDFRLCNELLELRVCSCTAIEFVLLFLG